MGQSADFDLHCGSDELSVMLGPPASCCMAPADGRCDHRTDPSECYDTM